MICNECGAVICVGDECIETARGDFYCMDCASERSSDVVCHEYEFDCDSCGSSIHKHFHCVVIHSDGTNYCDTCAWETAYAC